MLILYLVIQLDKWLLSHAPSQSTTQCHHAPESPKFFCSHNFSAAAALRLARRTYQERAMTCMKQHCMVFYLS